MVKLFLIAVAAAVLGLGWVQISVPDSVKNTAGTIYKILKVGE